MARLIGGERDDHDFPTPASDLQIVDSDCREKVCLPGFSGDANLPPIAHRSPQDDRLVWISQDLLDDSLWTDAIR